MTPIRAGVIGCGNISDTYLRNVHDYEALEIVACADLRPEVAQAQAETYGIRSGTAEELLADPAIDLIINLTVPVVHHEVTSKALHAGKHVYGEKPLAVTLEEGRHLVEIAQSRNLRIGSAPDTYFGAAHQACRHLIDAGEIGKVIGGTCFVMSHGMEDWHPNPGFFFQRGGGPILDVGVYYITELVHLLGPITKVAAIAGHGATQRTIGSGPKQGQTFAVEVPTHISAVLEFEKGAVISLTASWEVWRHEHGPIELYGDRGSLIVPDPNFFDGEPKVALMRDDWTEVPIGAWPFGNPNFTTRQGRKLANHRIVGLVDMAWAIVNDRPHRASADLALHVLDVMTSLERAAVDGRTIEIETSCVQPAALPQGRGEAVFR